MRRSSNSHHYENQHLAETHRYAIERFIARGGFLPASPWVICRYIAENANTDTVPAFKTQIGALAWWHKTQGLPDPTKHHWVSHLLAELKPYSPRAKIEFAPLVFQQIPSIFEQLEQVKVFLAEKPFQLLKPYRDQAIILLGFWLGMTFEELSLLSVEDIVFTTEGLIIHIPETDSKFGRARIRTAPSLPAFCPVEACSRWLEISRSTTGPLFQNLLERRRSSLEPISPRSVALAINGAAVGLLSNNIRFGSLSMRSGFVVFMADSGWSAEDLQHFFSWDSQSFTRRFIQRSKRLAHRRSAPMISSLDPAHAILLRNEIQEKIINANIRLRFITSAPSFLSLPIRVPNS